MIYGANGYTGTLVARRAVDLGHRPLLAGRNGRAVAALATDLDLDHRTLPLSDEAGLRTALADVDAVAHCAGPFSVTATPMVEACLDTGTHYLDITGEIGIFEWIYARHDRAVDAGVVLLPGAGFDVVPTDCVAARLAAALPTATELDLAFLAPGGMSTGTLRSTLEGLAVGGGMRRVDGRLVPSPPGEPRIRAAFASGPRTVGGMRWGDLVSAYRSTGIPTITTYTSLPAATRLLAGPAGLLMRITPLRKAAGAAAARLRSDGPDAATRARTRSEVWGQVRDRTGATATATLIGPNPYDLTADAVVRAIEGLATVEPGAHTPSTALGMQFVEKLDGVTVASGPSGARPAVKRPSVEG
jgi:short subunit dehydrogenase-like uncharacterized protein